MPLLVEVNWVGIEYGIFDVIQSYLVDHPDSYYMSSSKQWLCYLTRRRGLLKLVDDFSGMTHEEIDSYILDVLKEIE